MKRLFGTMILALAMLFSASALADGIVLPDPAFYFNRACEENIIEFDEYPQAEYEAYISLLQEAYGMEIVEEEAGTKHELVYLEAPGVENSRTLVVCFTNSKNSGLQFDFGEGVTLSALDEYDASAGCAACGGDALCDTCGGTGYLEMTAYGSNDTVRVACIGGCADGICPVCGEPVLEQDTTIYTPPIVGEDGLLVMSPEQYLGIDPCNSLGISDDACYVYHYDGYGKEWYGKGSNEKWAKMESYVQALVDSGYYMVSDHSKNSYSTKWCLRYIGPVDIIAGTYDIMVISYGDDSSVYYRQANVTPDDLKEKLKYFGMDDPDEPEPDPNKQRCIFCDKGSCKECGGSGFVYRYASYGENWREKVSCSSCLAGRCTHCDGTGWR